MNMKNQSGSDSHSNTNTKEDVHRPQQATKHWLLSGAMVLQHELMPAIIITMLRCVALLKQKTACREARLKEFD